MRFKRQFPGGFDIGFGTSNKRYPVLIEFWMALESDHVRDRWFDPAVSWTTQQYDLFV